MTTQFLMIELPFLVRGGLVLIVAAFMPLTAVSFFWHIIEKKERDFQKAVSEMGINTSRSVRETFSYKRFILPVLFCSLLCFIAMASFAFFTKEGITDSLLLTITSFGGEDTAEMKAKVIQSMAALYMAFLGSFIWSAQNIIRRLIAADLSPTVYYASGIRILLASVVALVFSFILGADSEASWLKASLPSIAFLTGMFPERILNWLVTKYEEFFNLNDLNTNKLSLDNVEGISLSHKERLSEIGIDNAQNLANYGITQLLLMTPFQSRQLLDWVGQSKLLVYAKENMDAFRNAGIRSAFDLFKGSKSVEEMQLIAESNGINPKLAETIFRQLQDDEGMKALVNFSDQMDQGVSYQKAKEEGLLESKRGGRKPPKDEPES